MNASWLLACAGGMVAAGGLAEALRHRWNLARIPIRIHVNGTRGKSGVTRLIAAGLRAGGIRTCAKTTGTLARMIFPDGSEYPVFRSGRANVLEQVRILRTAQAQQVDAVVMECMALQPALQSFCELSLVRSTHGVITNARPDHLDVMGPTPRDVAWALAGTVPKRGKLFTAEQKWLGVLQHAAGDRQSECISIGPGEVASVTAAELACFSYIEHADNVALSLAVCADLGVDRETALQGMYRATPDPGVMTTHTVESATGRITFVNGFAANDPESTGYNWQLALRYFPEVRRRIAVFNCRDDRVDRSRQLAEACVHWPAADAYVVVGSGTGAFVRSALAAGLSRGRLCTLEGADVPEIYSHLQRLSGESALVMGVGNIGGPGLKLVDFVQRQSQPTVSVPQSKETAAWTPCQPQLALG